MKREAPNKLKFKQLQRALTLPLWQAVGLLETIWHITAINRPDGDIGYMTNVQIAALVEYSGDADQMVEALVDAKWLDRDHEFRLVIHDWSDHVPTYLKGAYRKNGKLFCDEAIRKRKTAAKQAQEQADRVTKTAAKHPLPNQTKPNLTSPPPVSPKSAAKQIEEEGVDVLSLDEEWDSLDCQLRRRGMGDAANALNGARSAGCTPPEVGLMLAHWEAYPKAWGIGLLYARIMRLRPGDDPTVGWPAPSHEYVQAEEAKRPPRALRSTLDPETQSLFYAKRRRRDGASDDEILGELLAKGLPQTLPITGATVGSST